VTDWATIASLATAGGTLVLAVATFSSVRSANRAARLSERAFLVGLRPVLFASKTDDASQKIRWSDDHWARLEGGRGVVETVDEVIYLALSLRNVGAGIAVIHGWCISAEQPTIHEAPRDDAFRLQGRDLYIPPSDIGFWQAAIRAPDDPDGPAVRAAIAARELLTVDLLYGDHEGGQRTISRFIITPVSDGEVLFASVVRHWMLDHDDPRQLPEA
jgi:hypothetical protein